MSEWRDISTAPRDGTRILVRLSIYLTWVVYFDPHPQTNNEWHADGLDAWAGDDAIVGWLPLPEPPESKWMWQACVIATVLMVAVVALIAWQAFVAVMV